jgi:hypothetical protein
MIVNMYVITWIYNTLYAHKALVANPNRFVHLYMFLRSSKTVVSWVFNKTEHECPNCHNKFTVRAPQEPETSQRSEGYSLLRGEEYLDGDAVEYSDLRTSEDQAGGAASGADQEPKGNVLVKV